MVGFLLLIEGMYLAGVFAQAGLAGLAGMRVEVVSIGFGPRLARLGRLQLAAFPLGGFTRIAGLHATSAPVASDDRRAFFNRPWPLRALVVLGWPIGAELALVAVSAVGSLLVGVAAPPTATVAAVVAGSPAEAAGLAPGDLIISVDGSKLSAPMELAQRVQASGGRTVQLAVERGGEQLVLPVTPLSDGMGGHRIGVQLDGRSRPVHPAPLVALRQGARAPLALQRQVLAALVELATGRAQGELVGPVGLASAVSAQLTAVDRLHTLVLIAGAQVIWSIVPLAPLPGAQLVLLIFGWRGPRRRAPGVAARDAGAVARSRVRFPLPLVAALLPLALLIVGGALRVEDAVALAGPILLLLIAAALASGHPRAWAWGAYLPVLYIPSALLARAHMDTLAAGVLLASLLIVPLTLLLPPVRAYFAKTCVVCARRVARPVRSERGKMCCLACGSVWELRAPAAR